MKYRLIWPMLAAFCWPLVNAEEAATEPATADAVDTATSKVDGALPLESLRTFAEALDRIRQGYVEEVDDSQLLESALRGMLADLDPHSSYLDTDEFSNLQEHTTGQFGGIGLEVGTQDGYIRVISPMDDTPADKAGIEPGDLIIELDGKSIKGMSLSEAIEKMRGEPGSKLLMTIARDGENEPREITIERDVIRVTSVRERMLAPGYGFVRIAQFQLETGADMRKAINRLREQERLRGLVLDLRNNPGGVLQASIDVVDAFLSGGLVVYTEGRIAASKARYEASEGDMLEGLPIVVLVNGGSASASEIVAGALQDHQRAVIMGTTSFGKGSVQTVLPVNDERAIKLTTALYYTPNGRSIQAEGIVPDIEVRRALLKRTQGRKRFSEASLRGHLANGNADDKAEVAEEESELEYDYAKNLDKNDYQLFEALNLLTGLAIFEKEKPNKQPTSTQLTVND